MTYRYGRHINFGKRVTIVIGGAWWGLGVEFHVSDWGHNLLQLSIPGVKLWVLVGAFKPWEEAKPW